MRTHLKYLMLMCLCLVPFAFKAQQKLNYGKQPKLSTGQSPTYKEPKLSKDGVSWKANRQEYVFGAGASGFLGDLGGQNKEGKPFVYDYEPTQTRFSASLGSRYFIREYHAIKGMINYGQVRGSDALTNYPNRKYRNLNFKSNIVEVTGQYEFYILKPSYIHMAGAPTTKIFNGNRVGLYASAGAGFFYYNPKANFQGSWYALKPMRTEGQGLAGGPNTYKRIGMCFPLGGGISYLLNRNYSIGLDFGYRWTSSDYVDDASGYYYNNDEIKANYGKLAALLANPSVLLGDIPNPEWYYENQPRGGSQSNDTYMFLQLTLSHAFTPSISNKPIKQKKKKASKIYESADKEVKTKSVKSKSYNSKGIKTSKKKAKKVKLGGKKRQKKHKVISF